MALLFTQQYTYTSYLFPCFLSKIHLSFHTEILKLQFFSNVILCTFSYISEHHTEKNSRALWLFTA